MIKIENVQISGIEPAIRGMRNSHNSWGKSDSGVGCLSSRFLCRDCPEAHYPHSLVCGKNEFVVGPNDKELMMKLCRSGSDHRKFMRMIIVWFDVVAPLYWWKEFDTYKVGTVANSCSTMHNIADREFTLEDFSCEHMTEGSIYYLKDTIINVLNDARDWYLKWDHMQEKDRANFDESITCKKDIWWQMILFLPSSYNQRRTIMLSYEVLCDIYHARKNHKLDEWKEFCKWIEGLQYYELITLEEQK